MREHVRNLLGTEEDKRREENSVVVHAESTDIFITRLNKFWSNQYIFYNYHARTRSRSIIN